VLPHPIPLPFGERGRVRGDRNEKNFSIAVIEKAKNEAPQVGDLICRNLRGATNQTRMIEIRLKRMARTKAQK
jgi:hypothetical protein